MSVAFVVQPRMLSKDEARAYLGGISVDTLNGLIAKGILKPLLKTKFPIEELDAAVDLLKRARDEKIVLTLEHGNQTELSDQGEQMAQLGENSTRGEGEKAMLREDSGGSVQPGAIAGTVVSWAKPSRIGA